MGTSVNQRSLDTLNWRMVQRTYEDPNVPISRVLQEIWRAAVNQESGDIAAQLAQPSIGQFAVIAERASSPAEAMREAGRFITEAKVGSLAAEIAKRAAVQSAGKPNARHQFMQRLFAEATNYLVARDLPGHIGAAGRIDSASNASEFRRQLSVLTAQTIESAPRPTSLDDSVWSEYVNSMVTTITVRRRSGT